MIRHSSIVLVLFLAMPAAASEAPLYTRSVLYRGDHALVDLIAAGTVADSTGVDPVVSDSSGAAVPNASTADSLSTIHLALSDSALVERSSSFSASFVGAFIGTTLLGLAGGAIGAATHEDNGGETDWEEVGAVVGGIYAGAIVGSSTGAHLANGRRGAYGSDVLMAVGAGILSVPLIAIGPVGWFLGTVVQSLLVAVAENNSAKRHAREAAARQRSEP